MDLLKLKFNDDGLIPAIIQDKKGNVLMLGYMNAESVRKSIETGIVHFWSRSRKKIWKKGETSGHIQKILEIRVDCDMDTLLFTVEQTCGCCHEGYYSCFWRKLQGDNWKVIEKKVFNPEKVYTK
ncbi:MAG: phosphoribosyl-AMP cyclohydrolase [Candidatus Omnitrophica bacterium]|nr:phosphoribosyl-AMP cyclohydrolase [Candidatus Omnitrophota bacterium]MCM8815962.1 phosphoribosyl-AMP cyclohydrolase [Candidatus Omnitrophota bacterium]